MSPHYSALFVADALGLDFLNSIARPGDTSRDWIDDGEGLLSWLEQADAVPARVLAEMREAAMPGELDRVAGRARDLREWFRGFVNTHMGQSLEPGAVEELAPLSRLLERDESYRVVTPGVGRGQGLQLEVVYRWTLPESLLLPVGEMLARLVTEEDFAQVRACEGPACPLLFVDRTRAKNRRWCSMEMCGNRAKQAAHRRRRG
jgi:predicted RNA-binding Zn ribbon-like protein